MEVAVAVEGTSVAEGLMVGDGVPGARRMAAKPAQ
jgi:hypothetical protein